MQNWVKRSQEEVTWPAFEQLKLETSNLTSRFINKNLSKGVEKGSRDLLLEFRDRLHISGTVGARNVKFGKQVHQRRRKKCKIRSKPLGKGLRDVLLQFWYPLNISGTVRARNYKFGCRLIIMGSNERNAKLGKGGRKGVTWPTFEILGPPPYFGNGWSSKR